MLIIEGIDGVGKTTFSNELERFGFKKYHFDYDPEASSLFEKYNNILSKNSDSLDKIVLDRSFVSEMVYGPVLRGENRLSDEEFKKLLIKYNECNCEIIFINASRETLLSRKEGDFKDFSMIEEYYEQLNERYKKVIELSNNYIKTVIFNTEDMKKESIEHIIRERYTNENRPNIYGEHFLR